MSDEIAHDPSRRRSIPRRRLAALVAVALVAAVAIVVRSLHAPDARPTARTTSSPPPAAPPEKVFAAQTLHIPIAAGALSGIAFSGSDVWLANWDRGTVTAYSVRTGRLRFLLHVGRGPRTGPESIAAGDGAVWVLDFVDSEVLRVDASSGRITRRGSLAALGEPLQLTYAAGAVWVSTDGARFAGDSREHVFKLEPRTLRVIARKGVPGEGPGAMVIPDRRGVWVTCAGDPQLALLNPSTLRTIVKTNIPVGQNAPQIDASPSGIWVLSESDLRRLDPYSAYATTIIPTPAEVSSPTELTVDTAGQLWLTDGKTLHIFTPATGWRTVAGISGIRFLTAGDENVWIASGNELTSVSVRL